MPQFSCVRRLGGIATAALIVAFGLAANATPITVGFSGTMTSVTDPGGLLDPAVVVGAAFTGQYTLDPDDLSSTVPPVTGGLLYRLTPAGLTTVSIAGAPYTGPIDGILIGNGIATPDGVRDVWSTAIIPSSFPSPVGLGVTFLDSTLTRLASEDFFVNESLVGWDQARIQLGRVVLGPGGPQVQVLAFGTITSLVLVPEPGTALLVAIGLCGIAARGRMRNDKAPARN